MGKTNGNGRLTTVLLTAILGALTLFGGIGFSQNHGDHKDMSMRIGTCETVDASVVTRLGAIEETLKNVVTLLER